MFGDDEQKNVFGDDEQVIDCGNQKLLLNTLLINIFK